MRLNGIIHFLVGLITFTTIYTFCSIWILYASVTILILPIAVLCQFVIPGIYVFWDKELKKFIKIISRDYNVKKCNNCGQYKGIAFIRHQCPKNDYLLCYECTKDLFND